ncbi:MAG TPA: dihydrolipoyl dehydrogenase [Deltaproteobacteria bacterium]|nr:dihydrolipoyl dehydrogenase [Deltaproteobacteria bacterium]
MKTKIAIVGAGPGGYVAAVRAAQLGADVTVVERDSVGGTCLNWGCIPSKVMKTTAELFHQIKRAGEFGIDILGTVRPDMQALMERKKNIIQNQANGIRNLFKHHHIKYVEGRGVITAPQVLKVTPKNGQPIDILWDRLILAPGTRPIGIPALPFDGHRIISSNEALHLDQVPESILIVGGGVIGCEFAGIFSALGARVTVVEAMSRLLPLPSVDADCSKVLQREMKKQKVEFLLGHTVEKVEYCPDNLCVQLIPHGEDKESGESKKLQIEVKKILVCIGRVPLANDIGLETLAVKKDSKGWILTDDKMQTTAPGVYAIGDVLGPEKIMLAHVASAEGLIAAENAMGGNRRMDYGVVPSAIFTMPEVADVGLTEARAGEQGCDYRADRILFRVIGKAQVMGDIAGEVKIISERGSGRLLGVHVVGPRATELIAEATLALQMKATVNELAATIHAHPTLAEIMMEASLKALGRSLHG